jgi:hypothetical protein
MVSTRKWSSSSVYRAYVKESTLPMAALVPGMTTENSNMECISSKCPNFAQTQQNGGK